jgi:hypothetical protein
MPTALPVPIEFELPEGWQAAPPDQVSAPGAAFVAVHLPPEGGFTANMTIDGEFRPDSATLSEIADESVRRMGQAVEALTVADRREIGPADAPGLMQSLTLAAAVGGVSRDLVQVQVYLSLLDLAASRKRAVIRLILTCTASQHPTVVDDFQDFVRTVRPDTGTTS